MVQVTAQCREVGQLLQAIWLCHNTFLESALAGIRDQCTIYKERYRACLPLLSVSNTLPVLYCLVHALVPSLKSDSG